jgi:hypothetical protein
MALVEKRIMLILCDGSNEGGRNKDMRNKNNRNDLIY